MMPSLRREILNASLAVPNKPAFLNEYPKAAVKMLQQVATLSDEYYILEDGYMLENQRILKLLFQDNTLYLLQLVFSQLQESVK